MKVNKKSLIVFLLVMAAVGVIFGVRIITLRTANENAFPIYITEGETFVRFMDKQQKELYIEHPTVFRLMAKVRGLDKRLNPGHYLMQPGMKYTDLVQKLYRGQQDPLRLTIRKFRLPQDLDAYLNQKLMHDDFDVPIDSFHLVLQDTYEFYWTVTPEQFMQRMRKEYDAFWQKAVSSEQCSVFSDATQSGSTKLNTEHCSPNTKLNTEHCTLTTAELVVLASIVEEESNNQAEKPLIASVYLNRLRRGMPLQADPTVKYAVGDFTLRRILNKHLATESPFNTYLHTGLPPAPICLPSKASIRAVIDAPQTNYLYFCASEQMDGTHRFAATLAEHNRNAARFHAALNARGIR